MIEPDKPKILLPTLGETLASLRGSWYGLHHRLNEESRRRSWGFKDVIVESAKEYIKLLTSTAEKVEEVGAKNYVVQQSERQSHVSKSKMRALLSHCLILLALRAFFM